MANKAGHLISLEELTKKYDIVLTDNSALIGWQGLNTRPKKFGKKSDAFIQERVAFNQFKCALVGKGNCYFTPTLFYQFREGINTETSPEGLLSKFEGMKISEDEWEVYGNARERDRVLVQSARELKRNRKIIFLKEDELEPYRDLIIRYAFLKRRNKLGDVNYDTLMTGATLALERKDSVAIISNNIPLFYSWKDFL